MTENVRLTIHRKETHWIQNDNSQDIQDIKSKVDEEDVESWSKIIEHLDLDGIRFILLRYLIYKRIWRLAYEIY